MRTIIINGREFELIVKRTSVNRVSGWFCDDNCIFNWYERPSITKVNIWKNWLNWARETDGISVFEIGSANSMQFTIQGLYTDESGREYNLYITREHNRAYLVK